MATNERVFLHIFWWRRPKLKWVWIDTQTQIPLLSAVQSACARQKNVWIFVRWKAPSQLDTNSHEPFKCWIQNERDKDEQINRNVVIRMQCSAITVTSVRRVCGMRTALECMRHFIVIITFDGNNLWILLLLFTFTYYRLLSHTLEHVLSPSTNIDVRITWNMFYASIAFLSVRFIFKCPNAIWVETFLFSVAFVGQPVQSLSIWNSTTESVRQVVFLSNLYSTNWRKTRMAINDVRSPAFAYP